MPTLTILPAGKTVEAAEGVSLLEAIALAEVPGMHKADDKCDGSCHLFVQEGKKSLSKATREENERLDAIVGVGSKSRLACQAKLGTENVTVELLGFGSGL